MKKDLALFRAFETMVAIALVLVMYSVFQSGALTALGNSFGSWYSDKVDGAFTISVTDTSIKLPSLDRASLPLPPEPVADDATYSPDAPADDAVGPALVSSTNTRGGATP